MGFWSGFFKDKGGNGVHKQVKAAGVLRDDDGWYYEESQNFSKSQSTVRIEQKRPGDWETVESSCGIVGLNSSKRQEEVARFFAGSYRWLRLERERNGPQGKDVVKVIGTYRDKAGKERSTHLGFLTQEVNEELEGENVLAMWPRIRFIRFPNPERGSKYMVRFDLLKKQGQVRAV
jgi:hypothetical protein